MTRLRIHIGVWLPLFMGTIFFAMYAGSAAPGIVTFFDDSLEFQYVLPTFGIAHPTGYPLYTLVGGMWARLLPLGEWAGRVNLLSALLGGAAVGAVCALAYQVLKLKVDKSLRDDPFWMQTTWQEWTQAPILASVFAASVFGFGPAWYAQTTVAEVYALHNLLAAVALLLAFLAGRTGGRRQHYLLLGMFFTLGLGLAHHRTIVLIIPAIALYLAWSHPWLLKPRWTWWLYAAALCLPLLLYLWLPIRAAMGVHDLNNAYVNTWQGFWRHVLARQYTAFFAETAVAVPRGFDDWVALALDEMGWFALVLALWGFFLGLMGRGTVGRPSRSATQRAWSMIALAGVANLLFALFYRVGDVEVFLLPVWMCMALAAGNGVDWVVRATARQSGVALVIWLLCFLALLWSVEARQTVLNRSNDWQAHDLAIAMTAPDFPAGSEVLGLEGEITALRYMQDALGRARGVRGVVADDEALRRSLLDESMAAGVPVFLTRELPGIEKVYSFGGEGALVRVWPRGEAQSASPAHALSNEGRMLDGALSIVGYDLQPLADTGAPALELVLYWLPTAPIGQTLKLSLRVVDATGETLVLGEDALAQQDVYPLRLVAPTTSWLPGEIVRDVYQIPLPANMEEQPGAQLVVVVYDANSVAEVGHLVLPIE